MRWSHESHSVLELQQQCNCGRAYQCPQDVCHNSHSINAKTLETLENENPEVFNVLVYLRLWNFPAVVKSDDKGEWQRSLQ